MNKNIRECTRYETAGALKSFSIFLLIYLVIYFACYVIALLLPHTEKNSGSFSGLALPILIFTFLIIINHYTEKFNFLLLAGQTRKSILFSKFLTYIILSAALSVFTLVWEAVNQLLCLASGFPYYDILAMIFKGNVNLAEKLMWFFAVYCVISFLGLLAGALKYKFGKRFTIIFWMVFGLSWFFIPLAVGFVSLMNARIFIDLFAFYFGFGSIAGLFRSSLNYMVTAALLGICVYLLGRRQKMIVAERRQ